MPSFPKTKRLLAKPQFDAVLDDGIKVVCKDFVLVASKRQDADGRSARLGLIVSKKVGDSVQRNRVKRCVREVFRSLEQSSFQGRDLVVIARPSLNSNDGKISRDVSASFGKCMSRLESALATSKRVAP